MQKTDYFKRQEMFLSESQTFGGIYNTVYTFEAILIFICYS